MSTEPPSPAGQAYLNHVLSLPPETWLRAYEHEADPIEGAIASIMERYPDTEPPPPGLAESLRRYLASASD